MIGEIYDKTKQLSSYQPSEAVTNFTKDVLHDYQIGHEILTKPWRELNDRSIIDDTNRGQMMFNAFVDESYETREEAWRWRGTRSKARNKGIAMHAQLTAAYLLPLFIAQNENDEVDQGMSEVMRDIVEWMVSPTVSNYQSSFLQLVFSMEQNPVTYLGAEYCEVYQKIKEKTLNGYTTKEILDEVLSGFQSPIWGPTEVLISNAYERNIQKQRFVIKRRWVEKQELEAKWSDHPNWHFIRPGFKSVYNEDDGLFYDVFDDEHPTLVSEETYLNRRGDIEVMFLGGVYMGDQDIEMNPIKHRNQNNAPKYDIIPFGFYRIGDHFFYYKSMMNSMSWDDKLYDAMTEVVMNRAFLEVDQPIAVSGSDKIDSEVIFPRSVISFENPETRIVPVLPASNLSAGFNALRETENSMEESSVNDTMAGQLPPAEQKAYTVAQAQANAKKLLGGIAKSLAESIIHYGDLMKDIVLNHITVPQVEELVGGQMKLKYRSFLLENKTIKGSLKNKKIKFDESLIGKEMTEEEVKHRSLKLLEESGYPKSKDVLTLVNPQLFAKFKYLVKVDIEEMFTKNMEYWQAVLSNLYTQLRADPLVNAEGLVRRLLNAHFQSEGDDLVNKQPQVMPQQIQQPQGNQFGNIQQSRQLQQAAISAV